MNNQHVLCDVPRGGLLSAWGQVPDDRPWLILPADSTKSDAHRVVTYGELREASQRLAAGLSAEGAVPGDRIAVLADNSSEACLLMLGVLVAGMVIIPVAPRALGEAEAGWKERISRIRASGQPSFFVGAGRVLAAAALPTDVRALSFEHLSMSGHTHPEPAEATLSPSALALIQYTSGTTARPRGVALTMGNIVSNVHAIGRASGVGPSDVNLCWIPLFHDMGLIGTLLYSTYWGLPTVLMTPRSFLARPESWLWAVARFSVTCCAAPNSAYQICATKIHEGKLTGLDLSSWRVACNGSELVQLSTLEAFERRFERYGFRAQAMRPLYGLAECTVAVTFPQAATRPRIDWIDRHLLEDSGRVAPARARSLESRAIISVGPPILGHSVHIIDPSTQQRLPDGEAGEVVVRGPSVMSGYRGDTQETTRVLDGEGLRTGDRGYLRDGELYLVGRFKDVIKRGGRLFDAADIVGALQSVPGSRNGKVAVFGLPNETTGSEDLILMVEAESNAEAERASLQKAMAETARDTLSLRFDEIVVVRAGTIPRTTSGKIQHGLARDFYRRELRRRVG